MVKSSHGAIVVLGLLGSSGCAATTNLSVAQSGSDIAVKETSATSAPRTEKLSTTSFGNYEFNVTSPGLDSMTGVLPLKFNGGYLAMDILFFPPAMFFNLREPFAYYEFDLTKRVVRYRQKATDAWTEYTPSAAEATRGQQYFAE